MSCGCENKRLGGEIERARRLAKAYARMENVLTALYSNPDGTYGFCAATECNKDIVEFITQY